VSKNTTSIGWSDPRTEPGQLLWPERFGSPEIDDLKRSLGPFGTAGQLQQRPTPATGGIFQRHWWRFWQPVGSNLPPVPVKQPDGSIAHVEAIPLPPLDEELHSWDMAFKETKDSDFVVGQHWGRASADKFLLHQVKGRWDFVRTRKEFEAFADRYPVNAKLVEDKANGPAIIAELRTKIAGIVPVQVRVSKEARASAVSPQVEAGNIYLPHPALADWVSGFIHEAASFPRGANDDQVDAMSQALGRMTKAEVLRLLPEFRGHNRTGEPDEACHVARAHALEGWWLHWVAVGWVAGRCFAAWFCQRPDRQVHIYRELDTEGSAEECGVAIAEASIAELQHTKSLTMFLTPEAFDPHVTGKPLAAQIAAGAENVVGRDATFTYAYTDSERQMAADQAWLSLEARRRKARKATILLRGATGERAGGWEHLRGLLRWWPLSQAEPIPYDRETAKVLLDAPDGQVRFEEYMRHVAGEHAAEPLPGLVIHDCCPLLIRDLAGLVRHERKMDLGEPSLSGEAVLAGILGYRENAEMRPPMEAFVAQRLAEVQKRLPEPDAMRLHMAATKAELDWERKFGKRTGWSFPRTRRRTG
jgi:predicted phage terminase large subunit-like protein